MKRTYIRQLFEQTAELGGKTVTLCGWVRTLRDSKAFGFIELNEADARRLVPPDDMEGVDFENVRLLVHQPGIFTRDCTEEDIERCKWVGARKRV